MSIRKTIADQLRKVLTDSEEIANRCMEKDPGAEDRDRNIYKLGALEQGVKSLIERLRREDDYGRTLRPRGKTALVLALLVVGLQACGGTSSSSSSSSDFLGTWRASSGTLTITCTNGQTESAPVTDTITIAAGLAAGAVVETDSSCVTTYELAGDTATASPGQTCTDSSAPGVVMVIGSETFTTADGVTASSNGSGTVQGLADANGTPLTCTWTGTATYQRVSR